MATYRCAVGLLVLAASLGVPARLLAQADPDSVRHRNDCRLAAQVVTLGQPAIRRTWALRTLPTCGAVGGRAIAEALRAASTAQRWEQGLEDIVMLSSVLHDAQIFSAAADIAANPGAGKAARIQAIRVLYFQIGRGRTDPYESFLAEASDGPTYVPVSDYPFAIGEPLPRDAGTRAARVASTILSQPGLDPDICAAAQRLARAASRVREASR